MNPSEEIDNLIAQNQDWRGATLAKLRKTILEVDPEIVEEWKWRGAPVWSLNGIICVGNIFKNKVQLVFMTVRHSVILTNSSMPDLKATRGELLTSMKGIT